jgi:hypothetical protein
MTIPVNGWQWGYFMPIGGDRQGRGMKEEKAKKRPLDRK